MEAYKKQLEQAIQYAVKNGYKQFEYCQYVKKRKEEAKTVCLYGTGNFFEDYVQNINSFDFVCDSDPEKWGKTFHGKKCISPDELQKLDSCVTFIMVGNPGKIRKDLNERGVENYFFGDLFLNIYDKKYSAEWFLSNRDKIINTLELFEDDRSRQVYTNVICNRIAPECSTLTFHELEERGEYFQTGIFKFREDECYVDGGAFNGDTVEKFMETVGGKYDAIYAFEMDKLNYDQMVKKPDWIKNPKNHFFLKGLSDKYQIVSMVDNATGSHIDENGAMRAEVDSIDTVLGDRRVTFIKMDIEGSELAALKGAQETICHQLPKLAISAYHRLSDLWEIPQWIKNANSKYKVYLRHHTAVVWDTDCYAYMEE